MDAIENKTIEQTLAEVSKKYEAEFTRLQEEFNKKIEKMTEDWIRYESKMISFDRIDWTQLSTSVETT